MALAVRGLKRFHRLCMEMDVDSIKSFATAAVRDASNGKDLLKAAGEIGYDVVVLQGEEEAESAALGVISGIPDAKGIVGRSGRRQSGTGHWLIRARCWNAFSFPLGVLRVADLPRQGTGRAEGPGAQDAQKNRMGEAGGKGFLSIWSAVPGGLWPGSTCLTAAIRSGHPQLRDGTAPCTAAGQPAGRN